MPISRDRRIPITTATTLEYAYGMRGRICDLAPQYQNAIAEANTLIHPRTLDRRVVELMLSGRFRRPQHRVLRGLTPAQFREYNSARDRRTEAARQKRRERKSSYSVTKV